MNKAWIAILILFTSTVIRASSPGSSAAEQDSDNLPAFSAANQDANAPIAEDQSAVVTPTCAAMRDYADALSKMTYGSIAGRIVSKSAELSHKIGLKDYVGEKVPRDIVDLKFDAAHKALEIYNPENKMPLMDLLAEFFNREPECMFIEEWSLLIFNMSRDYDIKNVQRFVGSFTYSLAPEYRDAFILRNLEWLLEGHEEVAKYIYGFDPANGLLQGVNHFAFIYAQVIEAEHKRASVGGVALNLLKMNPKYTQPIVLTAYTTFSWYHNGLFGFYKNPMISFKKENLIASCLYVAGMLLPAKYGKKEDTYAIKRSDDESDQCALKTKDLSGVVRVMQYYIGIYLDKQNAETKKFEPKYDPAVVRKHNESFASYAKFRVETTLASQKSEENKDVVRVYNRAEQRIRI